MRANYLYLIAALDIKYLCANKLKRVTRNTGNIVAITMKHLLINSISAFDNPSRIDMPLNRVDKAR